MFRLIKNMTKKDFIYLIAILLIVILFQFLRGNLAASEVVNVISIGAGLTSIFLAMVAIEFSFKQSGEAKSQGEALTQVLHNINGKVQELERVKDELNWVKEEFVNFRKISETHNTEMIEGIRFIQNSLESEVKDVAEKITENPEVAKTELDNLMNNLSKSLEDLKTTNVMLLESNLEVTIFNAVNLLFSRGQIFTFKELADTIKRDGINVYEYNGDEVRKILGKMEYQGIIQRIDNAPKGNITLRKYKKIAAARVLTPVDYDHKDKKQEDN